MSKPLPAACGLWWLALACCGGKSLVGDAVDGGGAGASLQTVGSGGASAGTGGQPDSDGSTSGAGTGGQPADHDASDADPVWGCLGHVTMDMPQSPMVELSVSFIDLIRNVPVTGVSLRVCAKLDIACSRPLIANPVAVDGQGLAKFSVPSGYDGYAEIVDTMMPSRFVPSIVVFNPPIWRDGSYGAVPLLTPQDVDALAAVFGASWDKSLGFTILRAVDCRHEPIAGVTLDPNIVDAKTKRFFFVNGFPDDAAVVTDDTGLGGLLNALPGSITVVARRQASGQRIGEATMVVRAGSMIYSVIAPTP